MIEWFLSTGLEMVGPSKRNWAGIVIHMFFAVGLVYLAGMGYFLRDWKNVGPYHLSIRLSYCVYMTTVSTERATTYIFLIDVVYRKMH
jgi:hypothetical protein